MFLQIFIFYRKIQVTNMAWVKWTYFVINIGEIADITDLVPQMPKISA